MALWLVVVGARRGRDARLPRSFNLDARPCPAVTATGVGGAERYQLWLEEADVDPLRGLTGEPARAVLERRGDL